MIRGMPIEAVLDHIAVAAEHLNDLWPRYIGELGGQWFDGAESAGFAWDQIAFANGMRLEVLEPRRVEDNDFLRRFLDRSGPGAHHLTFIVPDLTTALARMKRAGYPAVNVELTNPSWREAFILPRLASGIVVQLADTDRGPPPPPMPDGRPAPGTDRADLIRIVHLVADLAAARRFFVDLLGGDVAAEGDGFVEVAWSAPGRLRLVQPAPATDTAEILGARPGRLHHLELALDLPSAVTDARPLDHGRFAVAPADNHGVGLLLLSR